MRTSVDFYTTGIPSVGNVFLTITFERNLAADDIDCRLESSTALAGGSWTPAAVTKVGEVALGSTGVGLVTYRTTVPFPEAGTRQFIRMRAVPR